MDARAKTWLMMGILVAFVAAVAFFLNRSYLVPALAFSGASALLSYFFSDRIVLAISGAKPETDPQMNELVRNVASTAGLPKPKVYRIDDPSPNAFATGRDPMHAAVAITTGLRQRLTKSELEAVLAHELSHIRNFDTLLMAVTAVLVGSVSLLADWFMRSLWYHDEDSRKEGPFIVIGLVLAILSPIVATIIQLAISRRREFAADETSAHITADPDALADALEKISADKTPAKFANNATAHLFITNPFKEKNWLSSLFNTHPPIEERVRLLRNM